MRPPSRSRLGGSPTSLGLLAMALTGCGTDVAQTAVYLGKTAAAPLDRTRPSTPPTLPSDAHLGGNVKLDDWVQATGDYVVGQGPGITVAALDAFRLFANGHLLATSVEPLVPTFVPLTLLPGMNGIAVVVTATERPPALLVELDELERAYGSDALWKVSMQPETGYGDAVFDDSGWDNATDQGAADASPGCDPGPGFPAGSDAHFIAAPAPGSAVFRLDVPIVPVGFGADTKGGANTEPVLATTLTDLVAALKTDDPKVVLLPQGSLDATRTGDSLPDPTTACPTACPAGSETLETSNLLTDDKTCDVPMIPAQRTDRRITVGSNTTLVGLGRGAALRGGSLDIGNSKNVIVRNVAIYDVNQDLIEAGDGISIDGADGVWIDHVTFRLISDGFIDATTGSKNLTFSWLKNDGENPAACFDKHPRSNELGDTSATIHHTLWQNVSGRAPLATRATSRVHLFDNVVLHDVDYAVGASCGAQVLVEATSFEDVLIPTAKFSCSDTPELGLGFIRAAGGGNVYGSGVGQHQVDHMDTLDEPADPDVFVPGYTYRQVLDAASTARFVVPEWAGAGARWALPLAP